MGAQNFLDTRAYTNISVICYQVWLSPLLQTAPSMSDDQGQLLLLTLRLTTMVAACAYATGWGITASEKVTSERCE